MYDRLTQASIRGAIRARDAWDEIRDDERGDIPGWVLITLMTVTIGVAIWAIAGPALEGLFGKALGLIDSM
ncbi:MAG TPA: hypothetical protein H9800_04100 [Candidatus Microbacterium stercoravium]|uniref:Uncharacterized protein n=1 Tax=Candidatus Microbacterium stercoravium TaxID=2838697 RepID=A0A9D2KHP1_9MICO|nr:hypothetical protein [Candidatus Microbacterium stercoravium]